MPQVFMAATGCWVPPSLGFWEFSGSPRVQVGDSDFHFLIHLGTKGSGDSHMSTQTTGQGQVLAIYLFCCFCVSHGWA